MSEKYGGDSWAREKSAANTAAVQISLGKTAVLSFSEFRPKQRNPSEKKACISSLDVYPAVSSFIGKIHNATLIKSYSGDASGIGKRA